MSDPKPTSPERQRALGWVRLVLGGHFLGSTAAEINAARVLLAQEKELEVARERLGTLQRALEHYVSDGGAVAQAALAMDKVFARGETGETKMQCEQPACSQPSGHEGPHRVRLSEPEPRNNDGPAPCPHPSHTEPVEAQPSPPVSEPGAEGPEKFARQIYDALRLINRKQSSVHDSSVILGFYAVSRLEGYITSERAAHAAEVERLRKELEAEKAAHEAPSGLPDRNRLAYALQAAAGPLSLEFDWFLRLADAAIAHTREGEAPPVEPDTVTRQVEVFVCPTCGPCVSADEDGCCATCGADCTIGKGRLSAEPTSRYDSWHKAFAPLKAATEAGHDNTRLLEAIEAQEAYEAGKAEEFGIEDARLVLDAAWAHYRSQQKGKPALSSGEPLATGQRGNLDGPCVDSDRPDPDAHPRAEGVVADPALSTQPGDASLSDEQWLRLTLPELTTVKCSLEFDPEMRAWLVRYGEVSFVASSMVRHRRRDLLEASLRRNGFPVRRNCIASPPELISGPNPFPAQSRLSAEEMQRIGAESREDFEAAKQHVAEVGARLDAIAERRAREAVGLSAQPPSPTVEERLARLERALDVELAADAMRGST